MGLFQSSNHLQALQWFPNTSQGLRAKFVLGEEAWTTQQQETEVQRERSYLRLGQGPEQNSSRRYQPLGLVE